MKTLEVPPHQQQRQQQQQCRVHVRAQPHLATIMLDRGGREEEREGVYVSMPDTTYYYIPT